MCRAWLLALVVDEVWYRVLTRGNKPPAPDGAAKFTWALVPGPISTSVDAVVAQHGADICMCGSASERSGTLCVSVCVGV